MIVKILLIVALTCVLNCSGCPTCVKYANPLPSNYLGNELDASQCLCSQDLTMCSVDKPPCPAGKQCVMKAIPTCTFTPCLLTSAVCDPFTACVDTACNVTCPKSGFKMDPNNCKTCSCKDPCLEITCAVDEKCVIQFDITGNWRGTCKKKEACPLCVQYQNPLPVHFNGTELNSDGCKCVQGLSGCPANSPVCPAGQQCTIKPIPTCTFPPCTLKSAVCEKFTSCPQQTCTETCSVSGFITDPNNCQTCYCKDPCKEVTCAADEKCVKVIETTGGWYARCDKKQACPPCVTYQNPLSIHYNGTEVNSDGCKCAQGLTTCLVGTPLCAVGQQCTMQTIPTCTFQPCAFRSADCEPFTSCPQQTCNTTSCPVSGFIKDPNGCMTCYCNDPCKEITCPTDKKCVKVIQLSGGWYGRCDPKEPCPACVSYQNPLPIQYNGTEINSDGCKCVQGLTSCSVMNPVCPAGKECISRVIPTCTFPPCTFQSALCQPFTSCPPLNCTETCSVSGYIRDPNNCQTCYCNDPCKEITCPTDKKCVKVIQLSGGWYGRCDPKEACPPCVTYLNSLPIHYNGTEINSDGCKCVQGLSGCPVLNPVCPAGQQCTLKTIPTCTFAPCRFQSAVCEQFTSCPQLTCSENCTVSGYIKDPNNCQTCYCNDPCKEMTCQDGEKCIKLLVSGGGPIGRCYKI